MRYRLWRLWHEWREESERADALGRRLQAMERSRSWRLTAPLRRLMPRFEPRTAPGAARPPLQPSDAAPAARPAMRNATSMRETWRSRIILEALSTDKPGQLFVDVTELALEDLGGGIQRVVRRILSELIYAGPRAHRVVPVRLSSERRYIQANRFYTNFLGLPEHALGGDVPLRPARGDCFIGLDLVRDRSDEIVEALAELRSDGVEIVAVVYDLLPLTHPEWFPQGVAQQFERWINAMTLQADRWACISETVRLECERFLAESPSPRAIRLFAFPLGADAVECLGATLSSLPATAARDHRYLMVGTIEPRKSHAQVLAAFEELWRDGSPFHLVIAGAIGWNVAPLVDALKNHPEFGRRLHWIEKPDDRVLGTLYGECGTLLQASLGEGLGLPIIEARRAGCRLILRDLPVFREVGGADAIYFNGEDPRGIVEAVLCNARGVSGQYAESLSGTTATWSQSAEALINHSGLEAGSRPHPRGSS